MTPALFTPIKVGDITLEHRIAMAPLTRFRAHESHVHSDLAIEYYAQRASTPGTLIISEATFINANAPGIWTTEQAAAWKPIVKAVHDKKSFMFLQLWALGRAADPSVLKKEFGLDVTSASDIPFEGGATPRPLTIPEIQQYLESYATAAKNFVEGAGGDGVEVHCANGYTLNQFLDLNSNKRTDAYGGSLENRLRFPLEAVAAAVKAVGAAKVGVRISPYNSFQGMKMPMKDLKETYTAFVKELKSRHPDLAYIHTVDARSVLGLADEVVPGEEETLDFLFEAWGDKPLVVAGNLTAERAYELTDKHPTAIACFGRHFIANPDLVERVRNGIPFTKYDRDTFYTPGPKGYVDYPFATKA
ncbi:hypothetical protein RQP46_000953 [Phenoliferia psychrophenolica]